MAKTHKKTPSSARKYIRPVPKQFMIKNVFAARKMENVKDYVIANYDKTALIFC